MAVKTIMINGVDHTDDFPPRGATVNYIKVKGQNEGLMLDGTYTEDILAIKAVWSSPVMPLPEDRLSALLRDIKSDTYVTFNYFDPDQNAYRSAIMRWEISGDNRHKGSGSDNNEYWSGMTVTFTEK